MNEKNVKKEISRQWFNLPRFAAGRAMFIQCLAKVEILRCVGYHCVVMPYIQELKLSQSRHSSLSPHDWLDPDGDSDARYLFILKKKLSKFGVVFVAFFRLYIKWRRL